MMLILNVKFVICICALIKSLFADDTNLFVQGPVIRNVSDRANLMLAKLHIWFIAKKLTLSLDKSCFTIFSKPMSDVAEGALLVSYIIHEIWPIGYQENH